MDYDDERSSDISFDFERAYCDIRSSIIHQFYELIQTIYQYDLGMISFDLLGKRLVSSYSSISIIIPSIIGSSPSSASVFPRLVRKSIVFNNHVLMAIRKHYGVYPTIVFCVS